MTEANARETVPAELDEADIANYLEAHPDFLQLHPDVLQTVELQHRSGAAVSLIERQVESLRMANQRLQSRMNKLIAIARDNEQRVGYLNELARVLISATTPAQMLEDLRACLHRELAVDALFLGLVGGDDVAVGGIHALRDNDEYMQALTNAFRRGRPVCGPLDAGQVTSLFPDMADTPPRSAALVPLGAGEVRGVLVLASRDPEHYVPEMGTMFLELMGELVTAACRRHLGADTL